MTQTVQLFWLFLKRDYLVYRQRFKDFLINTMIYPCANSFGAAYIQANSYFGANSYMATVLLSGNIIIIMMILAFDTSIPLLFDLQQDRYIDYQLSLLHPRLLMVQRILFSALFITFMTLPYFPISKLLLQDYLDTSNTSWCMVALMIFFGSLCLAAYCQCATVVMEGPHQIMPFWTRINVFLILLGGLFVPLHTMQKVSPLLGFLAYANPLIYITEGLRYSMVGDTQFLPLWICIPALLGFTSLFTGVAWHYFKLRTDHI